MHKVNSEKGNKKCIMESISLSYSFSSLTQFLFCKDSCNVFSPVRLWIITCIYTYSNTSVYAYIHTNTPNLDVSIPGFAY